jgi:hypothetical protein
MICIGIAGIWLLLLLHIHFSSSVYSGVSDDGSALAKLHSRINERLKGTAEDEACRWFSIKQALFGFVDGSDISRVLGDGHGGDEMMLPVLVQTPCLSHGSLGNSLSQYFEGYSCAKKAGIHYLALSPNTNMSHPFFGSLPSIVPHPNPIVNSAAIKHNISRICPCPDMCHEWNYGLMHRNMKEIGATFLKAILSYMQSKGSMDPLVPNRLTLLPGASNMIGFNGSRNVNERTLPDIPDVAIHYRCGDNTVTHYGFMPFRVFRKHIPPESKYIYVMAESPYRNSKHHQNVRCQFIFDSLHQYLMSSFPHTIVAILRGNDIFDDMARLTLANTTICSVSTFCLWPAVANTHTAYFPLTRLVAKEDVESFDYGNSFHWLKDPKDKTVLGKERHLNLNVLN